MVSTTGLFILIIVVSANVVSSSILYLISYNYNICVWTLWTTNKTFSLNYFFIKLFLYSKSPIKRSCNINKNVSVMSHIRPKNVTNEMFHMEHNWDKKFLVALILLKRFCDVHWNVSRTLYLGSLNVPGTSQMERPICNIKEVGHSGLPTCFIDVSEIYRQTSHCHNVTLL